MLRKRMFSVLLVAVFLTATNPMAFGLEQEKVIWKIKPKEGDYMKYFGKRVVDVNRAEAARLIPQEFGWQGNQFIFIFHITSKQLQDPAFEFSFDIVAKDYGTDEPVELDIYAGTNINNLKTVQQGVKIDRKGTYTISIPSTYFYIGSQNFIKVFGRNVRPIGYGENPPNCRFGLFKLAIPPPAEPKPVEKAQSAPATPTPKEKEFAEEEAVLQEERAATQDEMLSPI